MSKPEELIKLLEEHGKLLLEEVAWYMNLSIGSVPSAISRARKVLPKGKTIVCFKEIPEDHYRTGYKSYYQLSFTGE